MQLPTHATHWKRGAVLVLAGIDKPLQSSDRANRGQTASGFPHSTPPPIVGLPAADNPDRIPCQLTVGRSHPAGPYSPADPRDIPQLNHADSPIPYTNLLAHREAHCGKSTPHSPGVLPRSTPKDYSPHRYTNGADFLTKYLTKNSPCYPREIPATIPPFHAFQNGRSRGVAKPAATIDRTRHIGDGGSSLAQTSSAWDRLVNLKAAAPQSKHFQSKCPQCATHPQRF